MAVVTMRKVSFEEARAIAADKALIPVFVRGTDRGEGGVVRFAKNKAGLDPRLERIEWEGFEHVLRDRGLAVYESKGWMRIMRDRGE